MDTDNTQGAAEPSPAFAGSHGDTGIMSWEQADQIMQEQRAEIARLHEAVRRLAEQDATLSVQGGNVTVTMDATLTIEEREAVEWAAYAAEKWYEHTAAATLRGLLKRTS